MPQKCKTISYCNPTPYREPRLRASNPPSVWRLTTMHLKPYPKPQDKEIRRESVHDGTRGLHVDQQGVFRKEWGVRQSCGLMGSSGNGTANRCPLSVISTNTLRCCTNSGNNTPTRVSGTRKSRASSVTTFTTSLVLLSPSTGLENDGTLRIYQGEDAEGSLDIWAVIKPGNTKEKIAIFAAQKCGNTRNSVIDNNSTPQETEAIAPELRTVSVKNKGCWDGDWSVAKRRRRSGNPEISKSVEPPLPKPEIQMSQQEALNENINPCQEVAEDAVRMEGEEEEKIISVVEMVAYLEQRASDQQVSSKPPSLRSTSSITLSKVGTIPQPAEQQSKVAEQLEDQEEESESVRVLDMVAKLESQCLSRQSLREGGGNLSRSNSLQRMVGRVLLAGSEPYLQPSQPVSPSVPQDCRAESVPPELGSDLDKLRYPSKTLEVTENSQCGLDNCALKEEESSCIARQGTSTAVEMVNNLQSLPKDASSECNEEPLPGMLFFAKSSQPLKEQILSKSKSQNKEPSHIEDFEPSVDTSVSFREESRDGLVGEQNHQNFVETKGVETCVVNQEPVPFPLRRLVSHEFLETRFKIQLLLEPQQYMAFLPHHIIVKIFCLLPTESLAALKCSCHYFKFIIESYGVRPADSRWVSDPRYKDDPCKQCKKRYDRGDVSLCRWHHKPYCQALPYGPGYWMCCRKSHKDSPGCNVGVHDNRWVPAFHSINVPIDKKNRDTDEDS
ncbi:hypothetical protein PO909_011454 [Leuciscus waleckii]